MPAASPDKPLTDQEWDLWRAWKRAHEVVRARVVADITAVTGLSDPEFGILARIAAEGGSTRQNRLGASMGWHRSRLSHQLTRMEERGWLARTSVDGGVEVSIRDAGQKLVDVANPIHAGGVRRHLTELFTEPELAQLREALERLNADQAAPQDSSA